MNVDTLLVLLVVESLLKCIILSHPDPDKSAIRKWARLDTSSFAVAAM